MANATVDVIAPKAIILPKIPLADQLTTVATGTIGISGATLVFFYGTTWASA